MNKKNKTFRSSTSVSIFKEQMHTLFNGIRQEAQKTFFLLVKEMFDSNESVEVIKFIIGKHNNNLQDNLQWISKNIKRMGVPERMSEQ